MLTFRFDDVNPNTDFKGMSALVNCIVECIGLCKFIFGVTVFARDNNKLTGQIYDGCVPFKNNDTEWFYRVNKTIHQDIKELPFIASHGLLHLDHTKINKAMQEMNILTSCNILNTNKFIPPFNRYNRITELICKRNKIELIRGDWKNLKFNDFDLSHEKWYLHPWEWSEEELCKKLRRQPRRGTATKKR